MSKVELTILGEPMGKQRPRYSMYGGIVRTYTPQKTINYESLITHEYNSKYGTLMFEKGTPLLVKVNAFYSLKKSDFGKKGLNKGGREKISQRFATIKPDIDNVLKSVLDALNGICYFDDNQISQIIATKEYTLETPRVEIYIEEINNGRD